MRTNFDQTPVEHKPDEICQNKEFPEVKMRSK